MNGTVHRILVADDHQITRTGLCTAIGGCADMTVCGEAEGVRETLDLVRELRPDCLVLDLQLKDGTGWTVLEELRGNAWQPKTLVLSIHDETVYARRLLAIGAQGYLMKDEPLAEILRGIRKILSGLYVLSDRMTSRMVDPLTPGREQPLTEAQAMVLLSDRELQVYEMLGQGLGNKEIAARIGVNQKTIGTYKARVMRKLGARTAPELADMIRVHRLFPGS